MRRTGGTIENALNSIAKHEYVLPAIQREFVWQPEQVCNLFDSLMQGYPFGEFMLWRVDAENAENYRWYDFIRHYHQRDASHCPELPEFRNVQLTAVLDGQQRLTAFNIGLRGSMSLKLPHKWWKSKDAFPKKVLALDLLASKEPKEDGSRYDFDFISPSRVGADGERFWFKVSDVLSMDRGPAMLNWLTEQGLKGEGLNHVFETLDRLHTATRGDHVVAVYEETSQDLERVLDIFIRCNRGGTQLSYSNLLLSIAVSKWKTLDARAEVYNLVDELNDVQPKMFDSDFVLKAGLMLSDIASVGFKVENFTEHNLAALEANWRNVQQALLQTAELIDWFGFDSRTIQATNSLLPIAYYLHKIGSPRNFETSQRYMNDRVAIRGWLTRSLLKESGIWGSGLDTLLTALRQVIRDAADGHFPTDELRRVMAQRGKTLNFVDEEMEELADMRLGDRRIFPLLKMLFPNVPSKNGSDIDHVFPKNGFTQARLAAAGVPTERRDEYRDYADRIANLQLLDRLINNEKRATMPADWLESNFSDAEAIKGYCDNHLLGEVPTNITGFLDFYEERRRRILERIKIIVNQH